ncbi:hypothetical protein HAV_00353 [Candidatus Hepatincola sp. Av]
MLQLLGINHFHKIKKIFIILLLSYIAFALGNFIYTLNILLICKILVSELAFICLYTLVDKGNIKYGNLYTILSTILMIHFILPFYNFMFYSNSVHFFSISIATLSIFINSLIVRGLVSKGFKKIFSSRVSTITATILEVSCFSYLLNIGILGALITLGVRAIYIYIIPKIIIKNT